MTTVTDHASPRDYERRAAETRQRLSSTLDELADNLTAGRVVDELLSYSRTGGTRFLKSLGNAAAENPIPTLLVGVGAAMFMTGKGRKDTTAPGAGYPAGQAYGRSTFAPDRHTGGIGESASAGVHAAGSAVKHSAQRAGAAAAGAVGAAEDYAASAGHSVADHLRDGVAAAQDMASDAGHQIGDAAGKVGSSAAHMASDAAGAAADMAHGVADSLASGGGYVAEEASQLASDFTAFVSRMAREQPLMLAAAGLAAGAALAVLLPRTRLEDQYMGETADEIKSEVADAASEQYERAKHVVGDTVDEVREAAKREGLTADAVDKTVHDIGDKVGRVANAAGEKAAEDLRKS